MSIYPDRDKQGNLTGKYRVEVQLKGKRLRDKVTSIEEAKTTEEDFKYRLSQSEGLSRSFDKRNVPATLKDLFSKAEDTLWRGKRTAEQSIARCKHSIAVLGPSKDLQSLDTEDLDRLVDILLEDKSPATVNRHLSALHKLLGWAVTRKYLKAIPEFPWQREGAGRIRWVTQDEEHKLQSLLVSQWPQVFKVIKVAIETGMRRDELLTLEKTQVEPNWVRLWKTKTDTPRSIPISPETYDLLQSLLSSMPTRHQLRYAWDAAKKQMGLEDDDLFVFHCTRHTCATRLVMAGVNIRVVQGWLGHKNIETTLRYAHINDNMLVQALNSLHKDMVTAGNTPVSPAPHQNDNLYPATLRAKLLISNDAGVVKLADTQDLGSCPSAQSSPKETS